MRETVVGEETLTLTITGRTGSWLVSGVLGEEELPLQGMDDNALGAMLRAMLPGSTAPAPREELSPTEQTPAGYAPRHAMPARRGRHRRPG